jgi:two-component system response regulator TctD
MRILIVEDTTDVAEAASASLGRAGFACDIAPTLADARACADITGYAAIVLDLNLPDGSGRDFLRERRRAGDLTPVLVLTAQFSVEDRVGALDEGADDYLVKPFDLRELEARLRALTRREAGRAENRVRLGSLDFDAGAQSLRVGGAAVIAAGSCPRSGCSTGCSASRTPMSAPTPSSFTSPGCARSSAVPAS